MSPGLKDGSYAVFGPPWGVKPGATVLLNHKKFGIIVKQVMGKRQQTVSLSGTDPRSVSTNELGSVKLSAIMGRLIFSTSPKTEISVKS